MRLCTVREVKDLKGKRVLLRVDFNVPFLKGKVADDSRIRAAIPTIEYLLHRGAHIILISHLGRPKGVDKKYSLASVARHLSGLVNGKVRLLDWPKAMSLRGSAIWRRRSNPVDGRDRHARPANAGLARDNRLIMLENVRFYKGEEKNDPKFAKQLASPADVYVNDAFSVSHRAHASIVGVTKYLPSYAGLHLEQEVTVLGALIKKPKKPFVALLGGAKVSDKVGVIKNLSKKADKILLGGALVNNFFKAMGYKLGDSLVDREGVKLAKSLIKNKKIMLPVDVVVGTKDGKKAMVIKIPNSHPPAGGPIPNKMSKIICRKPEAILDIGPKTILEYAKLIKKAKTLVWNGPMGLYEVKKFSHGTMALGRLFASRLKGLAYGVAGGGETIDALKKTGLAEYVDWISMGGGAMLEFLEGKTLPGIKVLTKWF